MRERMLREISLHASFPSCAMQEGNFCSPENLYLKCVDFTETTPILGLKRFRIRNLDSCAWTGGVDATSGEIWQSFL